MATAILYISKHGTTEKVGKTIAKNLNDKDVHLFDLRRESQLPLEIYDKLIVGASIHMGKIPKKLTAFLRKHQEVLHEKPLALYLCCMQEEEVAQHQLAEAFPKSLQDHALYTGIIGGEFLFEEMNFIDRLIVKKIVGITKNQSKLNQQEIKRIVSLFN